MISITDNGATLDFYHGIELVKQIEKDIISVRTDGNNLIEFMESGRVTWYVHYDEMTSPSSTGIMDLMSIIAGYLGFPFGSDLLYLFSTRSDYTLVDAISANNATISGGNAGIVLTTAILTFTDLSGVTISDYEGTTLPTISSNKITFTAGQYSYLLLSDGTELFFNGHTYDSQTGNAIQQNGFLWQLVPTGSLTSTLEGLDRGYSDYLGLQVINDSSDISQVVGTAHTGGQLHNLITSYITFPEVQIFDRSNGVEAYETRVLTAGGTIEDKQGLIDDLTLLGGYNQTARDKGTYDTDYLDRVLAAGGVVEDHDGLITDLVALGYETNSTAPSRFLVSELNITTVDGYIVTGDKERFYQKIMQNYLAKDYISSLFAYETQKTGSDAIIVHQYIGNGDNLVTVSGAYIYIGNLPIWI